MVISKKYTISSLHVIYSYHLVVDAQIPISNHPNQPLTAYLAPQLMAKQKQVKEIFLDTYMTISR